MDLDKLTTEQCFLGGILLLQLVLPFFLGFWALNLYRDSKKSTKEKNR